MTEEVAAPVTAAVDTTANEDDFKDDDEAISAANRRWKVVKSVISGFMNNVGMLIICVLYCMMGGVIFQNLEEPNEVGNCKANRETYRQSLNNTVTVLWETASRMDLDETQQLGRFGANLDKFRLAYSDSGWSGRDCETMTPKWKFWGATVWCVTVVTTIGYGHIAPDTMWGKIVFIAYSLIGIPMMVMSLTNIGAVLADVFKYTYSMVCCCGCCARKPEPLDPADLPPSVVWKTDAEGKPVEGGPTVLEEDSSEDEGEMEELANVPLTISILIIFSMLILGATMFTIAEEAQEWDMLDSAYFSYVTLTTVGFGDMTPGTLNGSEALDSTVPFLKLVMIGVYMVLGMATVSMCLQMMQDEVVSKVAWISEKFGCGKDEEEEEEEEEDVEVGHHDPVAEPPIVQPIVAEHSDVEEIPQPREPSARPRAISAVSSHHSPPPPYNDSDPRPVTGRSSRGAMGV